MLVKGFLRATERVNSNDQALFKVLIASYMLISQLAKSSLMPKPRLKEWKNILFFFFSWKKLQSHIAKGLQDGKADAKMGEFITISTISNKHMVHGGH